MLKIRIIIKNNNNNDAGEINIKIISTQNKFNKDTSNNTIATGYVSSLSSTQNKSKSKKSNNFVNEKKIVIKPDPNTNKSIFNTLNKNIHPLKDIFIMPKKTKTNNMLIII